MKLMIFMLWLYLLHVDVTLVCYVLSFKLLILIFVERKAKMPDHSSPNQNPSKIHPLCSYPRGRSSLSSI